MKQIILALMCLFLAKPMLSAYTTDFQIFNMTDGEFGPVANGGLLYIQADRGTGFSPILPGTFATGDDFRLDVGVQFFSDPIITSAVAGFAFMSIVDQTYPAPSPPNPAQYIDNNGEVYPVGTVWRFIFFPPLTGLTPASPASAVSAGMPYAISNQTFTVPVETAGAVPTTNITTWTWAVIPEPSQVAAASLLALLAGGVFVSRMKAKKLALQASVEPTVSA